jgi:Putative transposase
MIVPGGGISLDGTRWVVCRPNFLLYVVFSHVCFRRLALEKLASAHQAGQLQFFGKHASLTNARAFAAYLAPLRSSDWVVYSKRPFGGPKEVLRYPCCGGHMRIIETFLRGQQPKHRPTPLPLKVRIDTL